jgi:hypothetical protein
MCFKKVLPLVNLEPGARIRRSSAVAHIFTKSEKLDFQNEKIEKILFIGGVNQRSDLDQKKIFFWNSTVGVRNEEVFFQKSKIGNFLAICCFT